MAVTLEKKTRREVDPVALATKGNVTTYESCDSGLITKVRIGLKTTKIKVGKS